MPNTVLLKKSGTPGSGPSSLQHGELALNYADNVIYWKNSGNTISSFQFAAYAAAGHVHGNITNAGAIGSASGLPIITTTSGVLTAGSFGTATGTFCQGNDSRLSDARTPTSHVHGNITNAGAIGSTSGLPVITTTSGVLTTGSFGTTSGTFCQGNDSRLSDASSLTTGTVGFSRLPAKAKSATNLYLWSTFR